MPKKGGCQCEGLKRAQRETEVAGELAKTLSLRNLERIWGFVSGFFKNYWNSEKPF